jgi:ppGpp synthetase/RelA/SpoT-type nucleotidyltranferase
VQDPVLCFYAFFDKHLPLEASFDPRIIFIERLKECYNKLNLDSAAPARYDDPDLIDLVEVAKSPPRFQTLVNRYHHNGAETNQAMGYIFGDTLILQVSVSKSGFHEFKSALTELRDLLLPLMAPIIKLGREGVWGCTLLFWGLTDSEHPITLDESEVATYLAGSEKSASKEADTKIGRLWEVDTEWINDLKILFSPSTPEMEKSANQHLFYRSKLSPADFPIMEMARHKFHWEYHEYDTAKEELERIRKSIDRRLNWLIDTQRAYGNRISVANSREADEFITKLSKAMTNYSDFTQSITRVRELKNTLHVNHSVFEQRAATFLKEGGLDSVFAPQLHQMNMATKQMNIDCEYYNQVLERAKTVLDTSQGRLNLLRGSQGTETVKLQGIQASAMATIAATALMLQLIFRIPEFQLNFLLTTSFMLMIAVGTFSLSQILLNWNRVHTAVERIAFSATLGFMVSTMLIWLLGPTGAMSFLPWIAFPFCICGVFGYGIFRYLEEKANRRRDEDLSSRISEITGIKKLNYAVEELPDLLEDLPVTRLWRIKDEKSLLEKIVRKGPGYSIRDIGDAIGIRYVVSPWELSRIVDRVKQVVNVAKIEYRNDRIGHKVDAEGKKMFQPGYKSVHIDADLWGVGDKRDINLIAEIQVRTRLQDVYANFCHDRLYKPKSGKKPTGLKGFLVRFTVYLLQWISDIELLLFGGWMGWKTTKEEKTKISEESGKNESK